MDPEPDELSSRERAASSEPCSTRPNPFGDDEATSSRKRQRVSRVASRSRSVDTARASDHSSDPVQPQSNGAAVIDLDPSPPHTPTRTATLSVQTDATPSRFTINLRTARTADYTSSPSSPTTPSKMINGSEDRVARISMDTESDALSTVPAMETPSSSSSALGSPEIELINMSEEADYAGQSPPLAIIEDDEVLMDPMCEFPFNDIAAGEGLANTVVRLKRHFQNDPIENDECFVKLRDWIDSYLNFTQDSPDTWTFFGRFLSDSRTARQALTQFFTRYACLTGRFVAMDAKTLARQNLSTDFEPDIPSLKYLVEYNYLQRKEENVNSHIGRNLELHYNWNWEADSIKMASYFAKESGRLGAVTKLARAYLPLLSRSPKVVDGLNELCRVVHATTVAIQKSIEAGRELAGAQEDLAHAYEFFEVMSEGLERIIEKHVTLLSQNCAQEMLSHLTDIYQTTLTYDLEATEEILLKQRQTRPGYSELHFPRVIALEWRFSILRKLITCVQMQLRVVGVTTMCADLLSIHNQYKSMAEPSQSPLLLYFANIILENKLIEYIVGVGSHPEIINESRNILGFLIATKTYTSALTDTIWKTVMTSQDPRVVEAIVRYMVKGCLNLYEYSGLLEICNKVSDLPLEAFTLVLREFCEDLFANLSEKARRTGVLEIDAPPYELCVRLIRESSVTRPERPLGYPDIQVFATSRLRQLLLHGPGSEVREALYRSCIEDLAAKSPTTPGSICAISSLLNQNLEADIETLTTVHGLTDMVIEELESAIENESVALNPNSPASQARRELLLSIIVYQPDTISTEMGTRLWDVWVGKRSKNVADRMSAWHVLNNAVKRTSLENVYLATCFKDHLPSLPPSCFTLGALDFARFAIFAWIQQLSQDELWEDNSFESPALEQLWRMILTAPPSNVDAPAIVTLVDVYVETKPIVSMPRSKARQIHLALVDRCLKQLAAAAAKLQASSASKGTPEDDSMDIVTSDIQFQEQETIFARSLAVLREFLKAYQSRPQFAKPKPRSVIPTTPSAMEGEPLTVKYQSFDGDKHTEVKSLTLGTLNTAAALFASLQQATGFKNYKVYHGGKEFAPDDAAICKSLEDLDLNGLVLVQRREDLDGSASDSVTMNTTLEGEIMKHLDELWGYLGMHDKVAQEIYLFLIKFPIYDKLLKAFEKNETRYLDVFPKDQPFKCLYAIHALKECVLFKPVPKGNASDSNITRTVSLLVAAISDENILASYGDAELRDGVALSLIDCLVRFLRETVLSETEALKLDATFLERLLQLLKDAQAFTTSENSVRLICKSFEAMLESSLQNPALWTLLQPYLEAGLVKDLILNDPRPIVRKTVTKQITDKCVYSPSSARVATAQFKKVFWSIAASLIPETVLNPQQAEEVLTLALNLFKKVLDTSQGYPELENYMQEWTTLLLTHKVKELVGFPDSFDIVAHGLTQLLYFAIVFVKSDYDEEVSPKGPLTSATSQLALKLFKEHLFPKLHDDEDTHIVQRIPLLNSMTRRAMAETIQLLVSDSPAEYTKVLDQLLRLVPYHARDDWPYIYDLNWNFERNRSIRSATGYVGLRNLSNTCYLNSLFTQLFMNVSFRDFMLKAKVTDRETQKLLSETQILFSNMQNSLKRFVDPQIVSQSIRTYEDTNIDVSIQMDVDEFYNLLFDRWEGQLVSNEGKRQFRSFYGGQLVQQVKSKECAHISERLEPFSAIQCDIKGKSSLQESLQAYVDGEVMEGDNKYKCSTCDRHVDAVKRACLKDIPDNLIFHLKRFDFNLRTLQRSKINDYFSFPTKIDMRPYKVEHIMESPEECPEDVFELVGILVHAGTAESGHYYSFIRERPSGKESWVEFNDDTVTPWKPEEMESSCFGGPDYRGTMDQGHNMFDKNYSAYMLFYQRSSVLATQKQELEASGQVSPVRLPIPVGPHNYIARDNELLMRKYCLYDPFHAPFVLKMLTHIRHVNKGTCSSVHELEKKALHMALNHLDQVIARTKDLPDFPAYMTTLRQLCETCVECCRDYIEWFCTHPEALRYLLLRTPEGLVRTEIASSIFNALYKIRQEAAYAYGFGDDAGSDTSVDDPQVLHRFVKAMSSLWDQFHISTRAWPEYFGLLVNIANLGDVEAVVLIDAGFLRRTLEVIIADPNLAQDHQYNRLVAIVSKRTATRPVSYESVISLLSRLLSVTDSHADIIDDSSSRLVFIGKSDDISVPLSFTEQSILVQHWVAKGSHIVTEKLLNLRQNEIDTRRIIMLLLHWPESVDKNIHAAIKSGINSTPSFNPCGPFLRAALTYCEHSESRSNIERLVKYIAAVARRLETNSDGKDFLNFFMDLQHLPSNLHDISKEELFGICMDMLPIWAPGLLAYYELGVRAATVEYIENMILRFGPDVDFGDSEEDVMKANIIINTAQTLASSCLTYLVEVHIRPQREIVTACCQNLISVMDRCGRYFKDDDKDDAEAAQHFRKERLEVLTLIRKLTIDEVEDEVSEWDGSDDVGYSSSQAELNDPNDIEVQL
ncbi:hypothetical protein BP6252_12819 [Coleophoma cylindrospora]|uniref:USP domain-containing protein n=1 Tax=Coleophoma cylindrospora TaxID=1849047 RepID=A0A3D8QCZ5_9HELO|nr:hypothetical protein BP6252_12819 [Coleophoma cylindrospora]